MQPSSCTRALQCISRRHRNCSRWCLSPRLASAALAWALLGVASSQGQHAKPTEYEVKATYLYSFSKFVDWPVRANQSQGDTFAICVLGQDPFGPALDGILSEETVAGKKAVARRIPTPQDALNCRVLFISLSENSHLKQILAALHDASVLTVSDLPQFTQRGGMVQFIPEGNRIRFEVNLATAEHAGLTLSSELLKVATNVRRSPLGD